MEMGKGIFSGLIMMFVALIIGLSLLSTSSDTISTVTDTYSQTTVEALVNVTAVEIIDATTYDLVSVASVYKGGILCNVTTHYNVSTAANTITLNKVEPCVSGNYNVTYTYRTDDYITDDGARSLTGLVKLFFALAVLFGAMGFVAWREFGFGSK